MPAHRKGPQVQCSSLHSSRNARPRAPVSPQLPASAGPRRHPAPPHMAPSRSQGRPRVPLVYVNTFGSHRCGSVIRYGSSCREAEAGRDGPLFSQLSPTGKAGRLRGALAPRNKTSPVPAEGGRRQVVRSCGGVKPVSRHHGDLQEANADTFDFPFPSRNVDKVIKRKKQKSKVWPKVWKVISKMLAENEEFRSRLSTCKQFNGEGNDMSQSSQNEPSSLDRMVLRASKSYLPTIFNTLSKSYSKLIFIYSRTLFVKPEKLSWLKFTVEVWPYAGV
ncbi:uncharacterized protein C5orf47 homolog [Strigops habroptila]|uniref:uncharacterized protein C5orf47 homolog n=1 Tax=Strigops habroptila TaxID=2489341 RepID=UPI0011CEEE75|nr:uncharacterized protein C5orf47 homolog [Strigops habroptila]